MERGRSLFRSPCQWVFQVIDRGTSQGRRANERPQYVQQPSGRAGLITRADAKGPQEPARLLCWEGTFPYTPSLPFPHTPSPPFPYTPSPPFPHTPPPPFPHTPSPPPSFPHTPASPFPHTLSPPPSSPSCSIPPSGNPK